ncbi:RagB/SusD family nutrient uptake outer membrane protein [termite gut metagenome]|uniref:RagB/SusD family nutrient uptake outer membrane protein n=1 Tax=termite gut metagenome TaxID=433724 RepID=A0A5J4SUT9_9ZZZZ
MVVLGFTFGACSDFLDSEYLFDERMSTEEVFKDREYSDRWLARAYFFLGDNHLADVASKGNTPFCFADDMYFGDREDRYKVWKNGEYGEDGLDNVSGNVWSKCYKGIRQASIYLNNIDINEDYTPEELTDNKAQAHFLKAYFYWILLRMFGPVPLLPEEGIDYMLDYDDVARARNTYEECVEYITGELVLAAKDLPLNRELLSVARPTRGAALALRAKVLLYAASPLMNGEAPEEVASGMVDNQGKRLLPETPDNSKWAKAAAAAKDVMDLNRYSLFVSYFRTTGDLAFPATIVPPANDDFSENEWPEGWKDIDPFESYRSLFNGTVSAFENPELIFTRGQNQGDQGIDNMVVHQLPRVAKGWNTHGLTQKQCDAYYTKSGTDIPGKDKEIGRGDGSERADGYVTTANASSYKPLTDGVSLQYADREPRFYASVAYNGSVWHLLNSNTSAGEPRNVQVFYYRGSGNGYTNTMFWLRTGIGVMKFVHPEDMGKGSNDAGLIRKKAEPAIRYAEILMIYAEALNELTGQYSIPSWDGSKTHLVVRNVEEMKKGIRLIRIRAGLPDYAVEIYNDPAEFRTILKRERQIELMGEGHRYYDIRRWLDAPVEESMPVYGCNALATRDQRDLFHIPVAVPSLPTTFSRKMWFWPINHTELRRNRSLTQNPGWTYPE